MKTIMGSFRMTSPEWKSVSKDTKELVTRMLDVNPATRITTAEILALPFIRKYETEEPARLDKQGDSERYIIMLNKLGYITSYDNSCSNKCNNYKYWAP